MTNKPPETNIISGPWQPPEPPSDTEPDYTIAVTLEQSLEISPEAIIEAAHTKTIEDRFDNARQKDLATIIVLGFGKDGKFYMDSNLEHMEDANWILDRAKFRDRKSTRLNSSH